MSEIKLQSDIVRKFSELYPLKRGQFFHVSNERNSKEQSYIAKSIGIFAGVSDFIYFEKNVFLGIEIKEPGSYHKRDHIEQQLAWGRILEANGGIWRLCMNVNDAISCTELNFKGLTISDVESMLKSTKNKTIKF